MGGRVSRAKGRDPEKGYKRTLERLQAELVCLQRSVIAEERRVLVVFEGRDAAGKDGTIKRITEHLSPRDTRVVALGKPSEHEQASWWFQRFAPHLPGPGEVVLFNRSWYNRAGVERVFGFCTEEQAEEFLETVGDLERLLVRSGIVVVKYYLDVSKKEQARRLAERRKDALSFWKIGALDEKAIKKWKAYTKCRDEMLVRTHVAHAPWTIVRADDRRPARLAVIRDLLRRVPYERKRKIERPDSDVLFPFEPAALEDGRLAR
jgi:polyphosphate kinase 2